MRALDHLADALGRHLETFLFGAALLPYESHAIAQQLIDAGAVTPSRAQRFHATDRRTAKAFQWLLRRGVVHEPVPGRYYLDRRALEMFQSSR